MSKQTVNTPNAPAALGPYAQAIKAGDFVFCSGQIAIDPATSQLVSDDVVAQTHQVMKNLSAVLQAAGAGLDTVVKTTIFLTDLGDFVAVNEAYGSYFKNEPPARATVQVGRLPKDVRVEIEATAYLGA
jgi:2-iminobutanoate/2-iminopropanoate deaminase